MSSTCLPTLLTVFFFLFSYSWAFNITTMLQKHPDFSTFNDLLSQTKIAEKINRRQTITVLAVDNGAASSLSGMSPEDAEKTLSQHVILDYYDAKKLEKLNKTSKLTTLFQASGEAQKEQGFLNVEVSGNSVAFGSAADGSRPNVNLVNSVESLPYNISILQVSGVIGHSSGNASASARPPTRSATPPAKAPRPSPPSGPSHAETPTDEDTDYGPSDAPSPSDDTSPSDAPSSKPSSPPEPAGGPAADAPAAEKSSGAHGIAKLGASLKLGVIISYILCSSLSLSVGLV